MKKKKAISYKKVSNIDNQFESSSTGIVFNVLFDIVCVLIFICSARIMMADIYIDWYVEVGSMLVTVISASIISVVVELFMRYKSESWHILRWALPIVSIMILLFYFIFFIDKKELLYGLKKMADVYMQDWNIYYSTRIIIEGGKSECILYALKFMTIVIGALTFSIAKLSRKNIILALIPWSVLICEILVGHDPELIGLVLLFVGTLVASSGSVRTTQFSNMTKESKNLIIFRKGIWGIVCIAAFVMCGLVSVSLKVPAVGMAGCSGDFKVFQENFIKYIGRINFFTDETDETTLTNEPFKYNGDLVMQLKLDGFTNENLYLKGFVASEYDAGDWLYDDEFSSACRRAGYDAEDIAKKISTRPMDKLKKMKETSFSAFWYGKKLDGVISYEDNSGIVAYLPYYTQYEGNEVYIESDNRHLKEVYADDLNISVLNLNIEDRQVLRFFKSFETEKWEIWYEEFVKDNYLAVPEDMECIKKLAEKIESVAERTADYGGNYYYDSEETINIERMEKAQIVIKWFKMNTSYTTTPPELPEGEDPIEYFLTTSKTGYCMHYASAATLIFREMGIPARFVTGYIARENNIEYEVSENSKKSYIIDVKDEDAHAWVEIYLEGCGWVPIEVTNSYSEEVDVGYHSELDDKYREKKEELREEVDDEIEEETDRVEETFKEEEESKEEESEDKKENKTSESKVDVFKVVKIVLLCIVFFTIGGFIAFGIFRRIKVNKLKLLSHIEKKRTRRAVRLINKRMYKRLVKKGKVLNRNITDEKYYTILSETYQDITVEAWKTYMDIVKKAAFSVNEITDSEMQFCYNIYLSVTERQFDRES